MKTIKNKTLQILALLNLIITFAHAQNQYTGKISGRLSDEKGQPMEYASVSLLNAADSSLIKGTLSSETGTYAFTLVPAGKYMVKAGAVGYSNAISSVFVISSEQADFNVPELVFQATGNLLSTVTITATKPMIERKIDRTVMNVETAYCQLVIQPWKFWRGRRG